MTEAILDRGQKILEKLATELTAIEQKGAQKAFEYFQQKTGVIYIYREKVVLTIFPIDDAKGKNVRVTFQVKGNDIYYRPPETLFESISLYKFITIFF